MILKGLQKTTLLDYPNKVACLIFTGGCNFRCPFCQNSELVVSPDSQPELDKAELFSFLKKRVGLLDGVCITGGEPLINPDIADFIKEIRALGYPIKIDTNGSFPDRLRSLIDNGLVDYVAMDVKNCRESYDKTAGIAVDIRKIEQSVDLLLQGRVDYEFRTTVANELHTKQDITRLAQWLTGAKRLFLQKFAPGEYVLDNTLTTPSDERMQQFKSLCEGYIENIGVR